MFKRGRVVVPFSGGIDSRVVLEVCLKAGLEVYPVHLYVDSLPMLNVVAKVCSEKKLESKLQIFDLRDIYSRLSMEKGGWANYYPGYGLINTSIFLAYAEKVGACAVVSGEYPCIQTIEENRKFDYVDKKDKVVGTWDDSVSFFRRLLDLYRWCYDLDPSFCEFNNLFVGFSQAAVIKVGVALGVNFEDTISCPFTTELGEACGKCVKCQERYQAFVEANELDVAKYAIGSEIPF